MENIWSIDIKCVCAWCVVCTPYIGLMYKRKQHSKRTHTFSGRKNTCKSAVRQCAALGVCVQVCACDNSAPNGWILFQTTHRNHYGNSRVYVMIYIRCTLATHTTSTWKTKGNVPSPTPTHRHTHIHKDRQINRHIRYSNTRSFAL